MTHSYPHCLSFRRTFGKKICCKHFLLFNIKHFLLSASCTYQRQNLVVVMTIGDPATFILSLSECLKGYKCPTDWVDTLKERDIEKEKANR